MQFNVPFCPKSQIIFTISFLQTHVNPSYYANEPDEQLKPLKQNKTQKLSHGDIFSLTSTCFKFRVEFVDSDGSEAQPKNDIKSDKEPESCNGDSVKDKVSNNAAEVKVDDEDTKDTEIKKSDEKPNEKSKGNFLHLTCEFFLIILLFTSFYYS